MVSKVHIQILVAIIVSVGMNIPYYFQFEIEECLELDCNCTEYNPTEEHFHPTRLPDQIFKISVKLKTTKGQGRNDYYSNTVDHWMHCLTYFSQTTWWYIWYIAYEVSNVLLYTNIFILYK